MRAWRSARADRLASVVGEGAEDFVAISGGAGRDAREAKPIGSAGRAALLGRPAGVLARGVFDPAAAGRPRRLAAGGVARTGEGSAGEGSTRLGRMRPAGRAGAGASAGAGAGSAKAASAAGVAAAGAGSSNQ